MNKFLGLLAASAIAFPAAAFAQSTISVNATSSVPVPHDILIVPANYKSGTLYQRRVDALKDSSQKLLDLKAKLEGFGLKAGENFELGAPDAYGEWSESQKKVVGYRAYFRSVVNVPLKSPQADEAAGYVATAYAVSELPTGISAAARKAAKTTARKQAGEIAWQEASEWAVGARCNIKGFLSFDDSSTRGSVYDGGGHTRSAARSAPTFASDASAAERTDEVTVSGRFTYRCE